jgi:2-polyprenyl-3-methyl-5-hydroxy-6-metoxy-1,4-benzoquinol methylase
MTPDGCAICGGDGSRFRFEKQARRFLECTRCGLLRVDPMPTPEALDAYYAEHYGEGGRYANFADAEDIRRLISEHRLERVQGRAKAGRWLDVGCSSGDFVAAAAEAGIDAEGLDISEEAVARAVERGLVAHASRVEEFVPDAPYDTITAFDVIEHLLDPAAFIRQIRSWLAPGGSLILTTPDNKSVYPRLLMRKHWFYYWPDEHLFYFDPSTIGRLLRDQGFTVESVGRTHKPMTLAYAARNLETFNETLGGIARSVVGALPKSWTSRPIPLFVGEMMAIARRDDSQLAE